MNIRIKISSLKGKIRSIIILSALFVLLISANCSNQDDCFCTEIFMMQMVQLVDQNNQPVSGVNLTITFSDSGNIIDCSQYHDAANGMYCILNDNYVKQLDENAKSISVVFEKSGYQTQILTCLFNTDPCKCHINLVEGKTTIIFSLL